MSSILIVCLFFIIFMKLIYTQLKQIFTENKIILFARIEKLNSKELLIVKQKLFKDNIKFKFVSNKDLKRFFSNFKDKTIYNLFKGEIILLFSMNSDWSAFHRICKTRFTNIHFYCFYIQHRFFFLSNLILRSKNLGIFEFLRQRLFNDLLKIIFLTNFRIINMIEKKFSQFLNILEKVKYDK